MSLTKLSLDRNNIIFTVQGEFGKLHPGWGWENDKLFYSAPCLPDKLEFAVQIPTLHARQNRVSSSNPHPACRQNRVSCSNPQLAYQTKIEFPVQIPTLTARQNRVSSSNPHPACRQNRVSCSNPHPACRQNRVSCLNPQLACQTK